MYFDYVLLKTDALLYVLLGFVFVYILYARGKEHLRTPWLNIANNKVAMMASVVLGFFLFITVLDSIHFHPALKKSSNDDEIKYSTEIASLFDMVVEPLSSKTEKTYSAPFATHLYSKETVESGQKTTRLFPRLTYGGAHLDLTKDSVIKDILKISLTGFIKGLLLSLLLIFLLIFYHAKQEKISITKKIKAIFMGNTIVSWREIFMVFTLIMLFVFISAELSLKYHILGTDKVGIDIFYQALKSIRTGVLIGTLTTLVMLPFSLILGIMAGYFRSWIDDVIQYLYTTLSSIPGVLLIASSALILEVYMANNVENFTNLAARADLRLLFLCIILGVTSWIGLCRLLRGEVLKLREMEYVQAARAFGVGHMKIMFSHLLPNVMHIVIISIVINFSGLVLAEAVLSYINIGVDPSMESWGNMINSARFELAREPIVWWSLVAAFIFMLTLVLSANLFADAVRDAFDPRLRII